MTNDLYHCFSCDAINRASQNKWCCCAGDENTLVCDRCGRCFCDAPTVWKKKVWAPIAASLVPKAVEGPTTYQRPVVLIIDDDRVVHTVASRVLEEFPGSVLHAYDGAEGLRIAREVNPELVITDCLLPLLDGREVARRLKSEPPTSTIRVVAMSAFYRGARYRQEALRDFAVDQYVEKPISAARLRSIIDETFRLRPVTEPKRQQGAVLR